MSDEQVQYLTTDTCEACVLSAVALATSVLAYYIILL